MTGIVMTGVVMNMDMDLDMSLDMSICTEKLMHTYKSGSGNLKVQTVEKKYSKTKNHSGCQCCEKKRKL